MPRSGPIDLPLPGGACLSFVTSGPDYGIEVRLGTDTMARCRLPAAVMRVRDGETSWHRAAYRSVAPSRAGVTAGAEVPVGPAWLAFTDSFQARADHFLVRRSVRVSGDAPGCGFLTAFEWDLGRPALDDPWFAPAVWYGTNEKVPDYAIGSPAARRGAQQAMIREDRLSLPFMLRYDPDRHALFSLARLRSKAETVRADDDDDPLVDRRLGFASLGMDNGGRSFSFWFPGSEAEVSYPPLWTLGRGNRQENSPVNPFAHRRASAAARTRSLRLHPLENGFRQRLLLRLDCRAADRFPAACRQQWRLIAGEYRPRVARVNLARVERTGIELLRRTAVRRQDAVGIPTWLDCFGGQPGTLQNTFGIGFVSRNLEAAHVLLSAGHRGRDGSLRDLGREILDFWTRESGHGLSHTEYDPQAGRWVDSEDGGVPCVFLRDQSESRRSCLAAWAVERERGVDRPQWLEWATSYGDWLASHQGPEGSFARSYRRDGSPVFAAPSDCAHVIPFLLALDRATGGSRGAAAAVTTARFVRERFHRHGIYAGATLDNPDCTDKESSALAFEAYLSLFEVTRDRAWLAAAEEAAAVCETWIFLWDIPSPRDDPNRFFPAGNGEAIAREIPGAQLLLLQEAATAIPDAAVGEITEAMLTLG